MKELENLYKEKLRYINSGVFGLDEQEVAKVVKKAFELGRNSKKCKEDPDNHYHIDYKRQTKLDL